MKKTIALLILFGLLFSSTLIFAGGSQQTSTLTAQNIMDRARSLLNARFWGGTKDVYFDDTNDLLAYLNFAIVDLVAKTKGMESKQNITVLTGVTSYSITANYIGVERAIYSGATTAYNSNPHKGLERTTIDRIGHTENVGEPVSFCVWQDQIIIDPSPSSGVSGYTIMLYLTSRPTLLTSGSSTIPTPAIYDLALTHFIASMGFTRAGKADLAKIHKEFYLAEVAQGRADFSDNIKVIAPK